MPQRSAHLIEVVPYDPNTRDYWNLPQERPPLGAAKGGEWSYIRREADVHEELFHLSEDANEQRNLAGDPSALNQVGTSHCREPTKSRPKRYLRHPLRDRILC
jgi:hypothetical protein